MTESGSVPPEDAFALDQVIGLGTPEKVGTFRFWFADQRWEWSGEQVAHTVAQSIANAEPFSSRHRIVDTAGEIHWSRGWSPT